MRKKNRPTDESKHGNENWNQEGRHKQKWREPQRIFFSIYKTKASMDENANGLLSQR